MATQAFLSTWFALLTLFGAQAWDKAPDKWDLKDVYRILQDSPWSPANSKLVEGEFAPGQIDPLTGLMTDRTEPNLTAQPVPGVRLRHNTHQPPIPVLWWSSKTVRLAQLRLRQLQDRPQPTAPVQVEELPDYVLVIEGIEPLRIFRDAKSDLHDTVFLELPNGATLDLATVQFVEGAEREVSRTEFHFLRLADGRATLDPNSDRVIFHCKAAAKTPLPSHPNSLALRAEFKPQDMRVRGVPDL